jgi:hypothetical protein
VSVARDLVTPRGHRIAEPQLVHLRTLAAADGHTHCASLDAEGNGKTDPGPDGHWHAVVELELLPAPDGHTHELGAERCRRRHRHGLARGRTS